MKHLTPDQLVDVAEGSANERAFPHLGSCEACRAQLADLRAVMSRIADVEDVPEPSPLFWDHLSARVRDAVASEPAPRRLAWFAPKILVPLTVATAALALVAALVWTTGTGSVAVPVPAPAVADRRIPTEAVEGTAMLPPDDPALDIVADLGNDLDWDQIHDTGIVKHSGLVDRAVSQLSADERAELGKMLKQELAGGAN